MSGLDDLARRRSGPWRRAREFVDSLAGRLLGLTALAVVAGEIFVFAPALAGFHEGWLRERINLAQIAAIALEVSPDLNIRALKLQVHAVDAAGHLGAARVVPLAVAPATPVMGDLVVSLRWDGDADLDLHVVDPFGSEVFARAPSTLPPLPPGQTPDPEAELRAGFLDFDSNAACVQDGSRNENVVWQAAPTGHYVVRVDAFAMCGAPASRWSVEVRRGDVIIAAARGLALQADAEAAHDRGGGVYALGFDL